MKISNVWTYAPRVREPPLEAISGRVMREPGRAGAVEGGGGRAVAGAVAGASSSPAALIMSSSRSRTSRCTCSIVSLSSGKMSCAEPWSSGVASLSSEIFEARTSTCGEGRAPW